MNKAGPIRIPVIEIPGRVTVPAVQDLARCEIGRYVRSSLDHTILMHGKSGTVYLLKDGSAWPDIGYVVESDPVLGNSVRIGTPMPDSAPKRRKSDA
jgi:hypothetical protein